MEDDQGTTIMDKDYQAVLNALNANLQSIRDDVKALHDEFKLDLTGFSAKLRGISNASMYLQNDFTAHIVSIKAALAAAPTLPEPSTTSAARPPSPK
jgi:hypothetical protein